MTGYVHSFLWTLLTHEKHLYLFELANQSERSPVIPVMQNGHPLPIGGRLTSPSHPWAGHFNTITPMMHPVMSSDRIRAGVWSAKSTPSTLVGNLHTKGSLEVNLFHLDIVIICTGFQVTVKSTKDVSRCFVILQPRHRCQTQNVNVTSGLRCLVTLLIQPFTYLERRKTIGLLYLLD